MIETQKTLDAGIKLGRAEALKEVNEIIDKAKKEIVIEYDGLSNNDVEEGRLDELERLNKQILKLNK